MPVDKSKIIAKIYPLVSPITCTVNIPGSKSYTNRALIIGSLSKGESTLYNYSNSSDSKMLIRILKMLGIKIISDKNKLTVIGNGGRFKKHKVTINVSDAGTVMRFLIPLCTLIPGEIILKGTDRMHQRPIKGLVDALLQLYANIIYLGESGFPPVKITGGKIHTGKVKMDTSESSQFLSALLMIAPVLDSGLEIICGNDITSRPYIDMTIDLMERFGVGLKVNDKYFLIKKQKYESRQYTVEGDASCATYFLGIAAITQSKIRILNLSPISRQGDIQLVDLLSKMGCKVKMDTTKNYIEVTGAKELKSIEVDMRDIPDAAPALAVVASFAKGTTILRGLKNLELKESNRLTALQTELTKMGIICYSDGEQLTIKGGNPHGAFINTYNDHRIAMAFAMAGTRVKGLSVESPEVVKKSYPDFWDALKEIGVKVDITENKKNIVLIGFMGAGKSTVGRLLAKKLNISLIETDAEIIKQSGYRSVNEIFEQEGEPLFRELEKQTVADVSIESNSIISCGGGIINSPENMKCLKENGTVIFLSASFETIAKRLENQHSRPLFEDKEKAKELFLYRLPLYKNYADEIIVTDNLTPEEITESILKAVKPEC